jgi:hypothetical protein
MLNGDAIAENVEAHGKPYSIVVRLPPLGVTVFSLRTGALSD